MKLFPYLVGSWTTKSGVCMRLTSSQSGTLDWSRKMLFMIGLSSPCNFRIVASSNPLPTCNNNMCRLGISFFISIFRFVRYLPCILFSIGPMQGPDSPSKRQTSCLRMPQCHNRLPPQPNRPSRPYQPDNPLEKASLGYNTWFFEGYLFHFDPVSFVW